MSRLVDEIRRFFQTFSLNQPGLVAVSGGADSVALLRGLVEAGVPELTVAHFNHQLRGAASDADAEFVRQLATTLQVPFELGTADIQSLALQRKQNLEAVAREQRYSWLESTAAKVSARWIATGHTADDQAETVLHRLMRGTGLQGLRGIAVHRPLGSEGLSEVELVRPLLTVTRAEVIAYLSELHQTHVEDASNADPRFTRNRIRHEVLPLLKVQNPDIIAVLNRLAEHSAEVFNFVESHAIQLLEIAIRPRAGEKLILDKATLEASAPFLVRELFRLVWRRESWPTDAMTSAHWQRTASLTPGDYPNGVQLRIVGKVIQLWRGSRS